MYSKKVQCSKTITIISPKCYYVTSYCPPLLHANEMMHQSYLISSYVSPSSGLKGFPVLSHCDATADTANAATHLIISTTQLTDFFQKRCKLKRMNRMFST